MRMPKITQIAEPFTEEAWSVRGANGEPQLFRMILGKPTKLDESAPGGFWYCPCAVGFGDVLEFNRFGVQVGY